MAAKRDYSNGGRIHSTPICVDYFHRPSLPSRTIYFLTHAHADHLYGLDNSFDQVIYCTSLTKQLLLLHISLDPELLVELELDEPRQIHVDCPGHNITITVTPINAHHCPGSAMFIFQGYFGTILHTGDFRLSPILLAHPLLKGLEPDVMYLDNTYNNPKIDFPDRAIACQQVTKLIVDNPNLRTFLAFNKIGKEELLIDIVKHTGYMIGVNIDQYKKMEVLGLSDICSLDNDNCQVNVVPFYAVTQSNIERWVTECPTQVIIPTCRYLGGLKSLAHSHPSVTVVHYSDHCSYNELYQFVELVKPVIIRPIVHRKDVNNVSSFKGLCSLKKPLDYQLPEGIKSLLYSSQIKTKRLSSHSFHRSLSGSKRSHKVHKGVVFLSPKKLKISNEEDEVLIKEPSEELVSVNDPIVINDSRDDGSSLKKSKREEDKVIILDQDDSNQEISNYKDDIFKSKCTFQEWLTATAQQLVYDQKQHFTNNQSVNELTLTVPEKHEELPVSVINQSPLNQSPLNQSPLKQSPLKQSPLKQSPLNQSPLKQSPLNQSPLKQSPLNQSPLNQSPLKQSPLNQSPLNQSPLKQSPLNQSPLNQSHVLMDINDMRQFIKTTAYHLFQEQLKFKNFHSAKKN